MFNGKSLISRIRGRFNRERKLFADPGFGLKLSTCDFTRVVLVNLRRGMNKRQRTTMASPSEELFSEINQQKAWKNFRDHLANTTVQGENPENVRRFDVIGSFKRPLCCFI